MEFQTDQLDSVPGAHGVQQGSHVELADFQAALPVSLIATKRDSFVTCLPEETMGEVRARIAEEGFDYVPVRDANNAIVGVLDVCATLESPDNAEVNGHFDPICEHYLVGAQASILEFLKDADRHPFRLLVTDRGISGLVSLSDVQRLPVRAALFAVVTQLEMLMAKIIEVAFNGEQWMAELSLGRREKLNEEMDKAKVDRNQVDPLLYTQFADKTRILRALVKRKQRSYSLGQFKCDFREIEKLRNWLAHGNHLATTRDEAAGLASLARLMNDWLAQLEVLRDECLDA